MSDAGWEAVRMVLCGLLPECRAAAGLDERERPRLEAEVAKAVVAAQEVAVTMLSSYREATRRARAAKQDALDVWWAEERRRRALRARVLKGLRAWVAQGRPERKRKLDARADAMAGVLLRAAEERRRKTLRLGGEVARTRAGGLHRVGALNLDALSAASVGATRRRRAAPEY